MLLFINEDRELGDRYLVFGRLIKDAELKNVGAKGTPLLTLKVSVGREEDIAEVKLWSFEATRYNGIKKGAVVIADCRESVREYNGKKYKSYTADFIMCEDYLKESAHRAAGSRAKTVDPEPTEQMADFDITNTADFPWELG
jgi:hypothetical protein